MLVAALLTGCSTTKGNPQPNKDKINIPAELLRTCPRPQLTGDSLAEVAEYAIQVTDQLKICSERIRKIGEIVKKDKQMNLYGSGSESRGSEGPKGSGKGHDSKGRGHDSKF